MAVINLYTDVSKDHNRLSIIHISTNPDIHKSKLDIFSELLFIFYFYSGHNLGNTWNFSYAGDQTVRLSAESLITHKCYAILARFSGWLCEFNGNISLIQITS